MINVIRQCALVALFPLLLTLWGLDAAFGPDGMGAEEEGFFWQTAWWIVDTLSPEITEVKS